MNLSPRERDRRSKLAKEMHARGFLGGPQRASRGGRKSGEVRRARSRGVCTRR